MIRPKKSISGGKGGETDGCRSRRERRESGELRGERRDKGGGGRGGFLAEGEGGKRHKIIGDVNGGIRFGKRILWKNKTMP